MCIKCNLLEESKKLNTEEYQKALIKKAIDLEYDTSYISLVALALALAGIVFVNASKQDLHASLYIIIGVVSAFLLITFFALSKRKHKLLVLIKDEIK